jgi:hypothetical protein
MSVFWNLGRTPWFSGPFSYQRLFAVRLPHAHRPVLGVGVGIVPSKVRGYVHAIDEKPVEEVDHRHGLTIPTCRQQVSCGLSGFKAANGGRATNGA